MNETVTYYDILGLSESASQEEITRAYRSLAKKMHPDVAGGSAHAMQLLNRAYKTLNNVKLREEYNNSLKNDTEKKFYEEHHFHEPTNRDIIAEEKVAITAVKKAAGAGIFKGLGLAILGAIITAVSYSATSPGGHYWVLWGLILWGGILFFKSWYHFLNPYHSLHKVLDKPDEKYQFHLETRGLKAKAVAVIIGSCIGLFIILGMISTGSNSSSSTTGTQNSTGQSYHTSLSPSDQQTKLNTYNTCKSEYDSFNSRLATLDRQMNAYKASDSIDLYNTLVPQQNNLVGQVNAKSAECERLRQDYNASL